MGKDVTGRITRFRKMHQVFVPHGQGKCELPCYGCPGVMEDIAAGMDDPEPGQVFPSNVNAFSQLCQVRFHARRMTAR